MGGPRIAAHSVELEGVQRPAGELLPITIHNNCSRWVEERYRVCAHLPEAQEVNSESESYPFNVMHIDGNWTAQRFTSTQPAGSQEGAFLHLQRWKGRYQRLAYGDVNMPRLQGRRIFKLSQNG